MAVPDLKSPVVQKAILSVLAAGGLAGVYFFTHLLPFGYPNQRDRLNQLKSEYESKATELARARTTVADLPRFEAEYAQVHQRWALTAELLPTGRNLPALLRKLTLAAQQNGVDLLIFKPGPLKNEQHYTETPLGLSVQGDYHNIGSFLADVANLPRIVNVSGLHLQANSKSGSGLSTSAEFTASAYSLNTAPVVPAPEPTTNKPKEGEAHGRKSS